MIKQMLYEVILDASETANKCTIVPLAYRSDFRLLRVRENGHLGPLHSSLLLHPEGQCLTVIRKHSTSFNGIASIDCVWNKLDALLHRIIDPIPHLVRIPDGFKTAYPRRSLKNTDPFDGLATIEALFIATALLGNWDESLLSEYYFGTRFIELNTARFLELGVLQAANKNAMPILNPRSRNSQQRRRDRGKL